MRTIRVPPGIGDSIWLFQKLINSGETFHFKLPGSPPQRGKQIFDLLPLSESCEYGLFKYRDVKRENIQRRIKKWSEVKDHTFSLSMNDWLEGGNRIEGFFPDLKTSFRIEYNTSQYNDEAEKLISGQVIGIYGSSYSTSRAWGFWGEAKWCELIEKLYSENKDFVFCVVGAEFDTDLGEKIIEALTKKDIPFIELIGQPLGLVIEVMKRLKYFFGFPSGLSILNETLGKDGIMFYPPSLEYLMNAWPDPERIENKNYKGCLFCSPDEILKWVKKEYKKLI